MHNTPASSVTADAVLSACALESELLNSERISERFGSCGIEVLQHGPTVRRSSLFSVDDGTRICRSYAAVQFIEQESQEVAEAHAKILGGESIGATFKAAGWQVQKVTRHVGSVPLPVDEVLLTELMHLADSASLGMHAYRLILEKDRRSLHYATIIEVHHPDYLDEAELRKLYDWNDDKRLPDDVVEELINRVWA